MNKKLSINIIMLSIIAMIPTYLEAYKYGLGSCLDQDLEQPIWTAIEKQNIDGFIFLGDNVYGDQKSGELGKLKKAYKKQKTKIPAWLNKDKKILAIWDDHDYGKNDGGGNYKNKKETQALFLDFWKIPKQDPRRTRKGIYFEDTQIIEGKNVQIIGLDTRYFRSQLEGRKNGYLPNNDPLASVLGTEQWKWLDKTLENSEADIVIILSSIQILATNHPYEKWSNFTADRKKLLMKLDNTLKTKTVVLISGDRHRAGLYQKGDLVEITASALNKGSSRPFETDPLLIGKTYPEINFGILDIQPSKNIITLSINNKDGVELESKVINL
ncbi:alkaline phosphatase family protein [Gammaproteobacteria bacterium]|nr:alkaline phosphatase family protein [Gammaproteobacteria bacterium]